MILITGATGKTGKAVLRALTRLGTGVRALSRKLEQVEMLKDLGASEVVLGDMQSPADLEKALLGIRTVYMICPNMHPDETAIGARLIQAAEAAGVERFVYHSVLHPQAEDMPHHWNKLRVEELLFKSALDYSILQPCAYMQNILTNWQQVTTRGIYAVPYRPETRLSLVDLDDVAEAAARVLIESGHTGATSHTGAPSHTGATYELVGTPPLTQIEVAAVLSATLNRPVSATAISLEDWEKGVRAAGLSDYSIQTLKKMFIYYENFGLWGSPQVLTSLLGRAPTPLASFLKRIYIERYHA